MALAPLTTGGLLVCDFGRVSMNRQVGGLLPDRNLDPEVAVATEHRDLLRRLVPWHEHFAVRKHDADIMCATDRKASLITSATHTNTTA